MCVKCNKIFINNFRNFRNCQCKQGVTNIIFTVFQSGWTVLGEKNSQNQSRKCRSKSSMKSFLHLFCLKSFYTSARKQDGSYYKTSSMKSIRAAIDRFLRSPPHCKQFSIIGDPAFTEANQVLDAFVKDLRKTGKIAGVVHKKPITKQQIQRLNECGELGPANSTNPAQLQRTVWFYLVLYFGQSAA